jgi:hypothetical protein
MTHAEFMNKYYESMYYFYIKELSEYKVIRMDIKDKITELQRDILKLDFNKALSYNQLKYIDKNNREFYIFLLAYRKYLIEVLVRQDVGCMKKYIDNVTENIRETINNSCNNNY